ncbi:PAS domain S-box protein [Aquihabitans sp. McL0605]|uniref:sensor histidine kinase n=1 Tax=Aquihabitans sp. McL0605 TaxID=3415671 RepID=UPI003CEC5B5F
MGHRSQLLDGVGDDFAWSLFDAAPDGILVVAESGEIAFANDQAGTLLGAEAKELVGTSVDDLLPTQLRGRHRAHRTRYRAHPEVRSMGAGLELRARRVDGTEFDAEISLSPLTLDGGLFVVAAIRNIAERLAAAEELRVSQEQLQDAKQVLALAEDRDRIARDLHDTVIQRLFAAGLSLQAAASLSDERVRPRLEATINDLDETIRELRIAIFSLQTPLAQAPSVRGRLLDVISGLDLGFEPTVMFEGPIESVDEPIVNHVVPVLREALSNVVQHARASTASVEVSVGDSFRLTVDDDGCGLGGSGSDGDGLRGNGITNITGRAEELGGAASLSPRPEGGCRLEWTVPLGR